MTIQLRSRAARSEALGKQIVAEHLANIEALADPRPTSVTLAHFMLRDMNADIAAKRCTVTCVHRCFSSLPRLVIRQVRYLPNNGRPYIIVTDTGDEWQTFSGQEHLTIIWHEPLPDDVWMKLTKPMHSALCHLAGDTPKGQKKPRTNTVRALESRRLVEHGQLTPSALALYRQHRAELINV